MTVALHPAARPGRYRTREVAQFELAKIMTLRSTAITFGLSVVAGLLVTGLVAHAQLSQQLGPGFDPTSTALSGMIPAALTGGVFGALLITGEYASGTIRTTLAAVPRRSFLLAVKLAVAAGLLLAFFEAMSFATFFLGQAVLSGGAPTAGLGSPGAARAVLLTGLFVTLLALMSFGFGVIFRSTAAGIAAFVGVVFVLPLVMHGISQAGVRYMPTNILTNSIMSTVGPQVVGAGPKGGPGPVGNLPLSPGIGMLMMALYAAAALAVGAALFLRRDA